MNDGNKALAFLAVASLGLACGGSGLTSRVPGTGGQGGSAAAGGAPGSAGAGSGGALAAGGAAGPQSSGGSPAGTAAGGSISTGGNPGTGGRGGANAGGSPGAGGNPSGGASGVGTICLPMVGVCPAILCPYGEIPSPNPCSCPICAPPPDAGLVQDAAVDGPCLALPCPYPLCPAGSVVVTPPCGCPTCVPVDAGAPDGAACPPVACPAIACLSGTVPNPNDPCGCPLCAPADAAADTTKLDCVGLDECTCRLTNGCTAVAEACYCPFPSCDPSGACVCGGGKFAGCAPVNLATCANAKARVAGLCPQLQGLTFDGLCNQADSACITKCLNDVGSCSEVSCTFCEVCDCAGDPFSACVHTCRTALGQ